MNFSFLNLDDLKEQLKDQWNKIREKIDENPHFNTLKEVYENLPSRYQKILFFGAIFFVLFLIFLFPLGYFMSSIHYEKQYEENKEIILSLMEAEIEKTKGLLLPSSFKMYKDEQKLKRSLLNFPILKEQRTDIKPFKVPKSLQPNPIKSEGLSVGFKNLNLTEVVRIGHKLQNAAPYIKLIGLEMKESSDKPLYFDVHYKLASFYISESQKKPSKRSKKK